MFEKDPRVTSYSVYNRWRSRQDFHSDLHKQFRTEGEPPEGETGHFMTDPRRFCLTFVSDLT